MDPKADAIDTPIFFPENSYWLSDNEEEAPELWQAICKLAEDFEEDDESIFSVLHKGACEPARPLVVWVHPGDACESDHCSEEVANSSLELQKGMGQELKDFGDCDVVVLHRYSSKFAFECTNRVDDDYFQAMTQCLKDKRATHVFGDDLSVAGDWLLSNMAVQGRPDVLLTGAWSHPEWGCVSEIGKILHSAGAANLRVSWASPSDPGSVEDAWRPPSPTDPAAPKRPGTPR